MPPVRNDPLAMRRQEVRAGDVRYERLSLIRDIRGQQLREVGPIRINDVIAPVPASRLPLPDGLIVKWT